MFDLQPISTTNIISIIQLVAVIVGFYFSWRTLTLGAQNAQAQLYNNMLTQGRELQRKFMDEWVESENKTGFFQGIIIGYYASCFELRRVLSLPPSAVKLLDNDVKESMRDPSFKKRFEELKNLYSKEFLQYVHGLEGV